MKPLLLILFSILTFLTVSAQKLTVESFVPTTDAIARTRNVKGTDGNVCAAVVVRIPSESATFNGGFILNKPTYKDGEYILNMQTGAAQMRVSVPGYNTIDVKFRDYIGSTLQSKTTYLLTINMPQGSNTQQKLCDICERPLSQCDYGGKHPYCQTCGKLKEKCEYQGNHTNGGAQSVQSIQQQPLANTFAPQTFTVKGVSFTMMPVEGGTFTMGATSEMTESWDDEKPTHQVTLSSYYIGETEVTQALWQAVMGKNPSKYQGDLHPVETVSWDDCQKFIKKLNKATGKKFRLPTEAEWEFAARGGNKSRHTQYSGSTNIDEVAWYYNNSGIVTHSVKQKKANELGIYDMSGNVREWCQDWKGTYNSNAQTNPVGVLRGSYRVHRGGGMYDNAWGCRSSLRKSYTPISCDNALGLRLALSE